MANSRTDIDTFYPTRSSYRVTRMLGWLMSTGLLFCACVALFVSIRLWGTYTHTFKPYLKWQDALLYSLWFITFVGLGGAILVGRFLFAAHDGFRQGTLRFVGNTHIAVRDTSYGNLGSIFWMLNAAFWCFITILVGLVPVILIGWTVHLSSLFLIIVATSLAGLLSLVGFAASAVAASFIVIGIVGSFSFSQKMGATHLYPVDNKLTLRLDGSLLTVIYPDMPETMLDLNTFEPRERQSLLVMLYERWEHAARSWLLEWDEQSAMTSVATKNALPASILVRKG